MGISLQWLVIPAVNGSKILKAFPRLVRCFYDCRRVIVYRCDRPSAEGEERLDPACGREIFLRHAPEHPYLVARLPLLDQRIAQGDEPCLFFDSGHLIHMAWWGPRTTIDPDYELGTSFPFPLPENAALIYDCWTPESARGQGYYPRVLCQLCRRLLSRYTSVWIYALETNRASRRGIEKAGFREIACLERRRWLGYISCTRTVTLREKGY